MNLSWIKRLYECFDSLTKQNVHKLKNAILLLPPKIWRPLPFWLFPVVIVWFIFHKIFYIAPNKIDCTSFHEKIITFGERKIQFASAWNWHKFKIQLMLFMLLFYNVEIKNASSTTFYYSKKKADASFMT